MESTTAKKTSREKQSLGLLNANKIGRGLKVLLQATPIRAEPTRAWCGFMCPGMTNHQCKELALIFAYSLVSVTQ